MGSRSLKCKRHAFSELRSKTLLSAPELQTAESGIKIQRGLIVGQCPHNGGSVAVRCKIPACGVEEATSKAKALKFRKKVEFEHFAAKRYRRNAIFSVAHISNDAFVEFQDQ